MPDTPPIPTEVTEVLAEVAERLTTALRYYSGAFQAAMAALAPAVDLLGRPEVATPNADGILITGHFAAYLDDEPAYRSDDRRRTLEVEYARVRPPRDALAAATTAAAALLGVITDLAATLATALEEEPA